MNKISCNVIRDLMILYEDDVCSEESRGVIEEHIEECEECRRICQMARQPLPEISLGQESGAKRGDGDEFWEIARRAVRKFERKVTLRQTMIFAIVLAMILMGASIWDGWLQYQIFVVPSEEVKVTELYELENGDIFCTFTGKELIGRVNTSELKVPVEKGYRDYAQGWYEISFQYPMPHEKDIEEAVYSNEVSMVFKREEREIGNWLEDEEGNMIPDESSVRNTTTCASIYYYGKNKEDKLLVWEEGQKIESAPDTIEKLVRDDEEKNGVFCWEYTTRRIDKDR